MEKVYRQPMLECSVLASQNDLGRKDALLHL